MEELEREKNSLNLEFEDFKLKIENIALMREDFFQRKLNYSQIVDEIFDQDINALSFGCEKIKPMAEKIKLVRKKLAQRGYFNSVTKETCERLILQYDEQISVVSLLFNDLEQ